MEHTQVDTANGGEKTAKEGTVSEEEGPEFFSDSENTVAVPHIQNLKRHGGSTVNGVFCTAGGAETAVAAERDKFKSATFVTSIHGATERRVTTVKHDVLEDVHKTIMQDMSAESTPPLMNEG